jgi:hypothetical protein
MTNLFIKYKKKIELILVMLCLKNFVTLHTFFVFTQRDLLQCYIQQPHLNQKTQNKTTQKNQQSFLDTKI